MANEKSILFSRSFWLGIFNVVAGIVGVVLGSELIKDHPTIVACLAIASGVAQVFIRTITTKPVTIRRKRKKSATKSIKSE